MRPLLSRGHTPPSRGFCPELSPGYRAVTTVPAEETEPRPGARAALHLLYPPTCIACGGATAAPHGLCARCWGGLSLIERPFCERLGTPFAVDLGMLLLSPAAIANPPVFERARAVARFDETAQALVHRLKYGAGSSSPGRSAPPWRGPEPSSRGTRT